MEIIYHLGLHCTDEDRLRKTLLNNRNTLLEQGIVIPGPSRYRRQIRQASQRVSGKMMGAHDPDAVIAEILDGDEAERIVLSSRQFLGPPSDVHGQNRLYPKADGQFKVLRNIFPDHHVEFHFALRDLATFFPAAFAASDASSFQAFMGKCDVRKFAWVELVERLRDAVPDAPFVIWANEDTPLIWPEILETVSGHAPNTVLKGREEILEDIMRPGGFRRLRGYLEKRPPDSLATYAKIATVFLEKYIDEAKMEEEYDLPGWSPKVMEFLSKAYEEDLEEVAEIPGVDMIAPV